MRSILVAGGLALAGILTTSTAHAQSFGIGGRISMIRGDVEAGTGAERFTGGHLRLRTSHRTAVELSLDRRTETNAEGTERTRDSPLQASLLFFAIRAAISPYVLGGAGWYSHRLERLDGGAVLDSETTREFGYHAGLGAELRLGNHAGLHGDYRYTFLRFGSDDEEAEGARSSRFLPSYRGSMWTAGLTIYF